MTVKQYPTRIKTAKREEKNGGAFFLDLDTIEAWIHALPRGSAGKTAQQLFSGLQDINKIKLDCEDRVDYLELIREPLFYTMSIMEKHFIGENFPLTQKQKKIVSLSKEFCLLMMTGYVIAIEELLEDYKERRDKNLLGQLIHRSISFLNHYLLISYQAYMIVPDDIWDKFHKLYLFAEEKKVSDIKITDEKFQYINKTTIAEEYMRGLLLATASPYQMRRKEIGNAYINIERWLDSVKLFHSDESIKSKYIIVVDLTSNKPVIYGDELKGRRKKNLRIISIDQLIHKIDHELQSGEMISSQTLISANLGDATLSHDLLKRLQHFWTSKPESPIKNGKTRQKVRMTVGISATHNLALETKQTGNDIQLFRQLSDFDDMEVKSIRKKAPLDAMNKDKIFAGNTQKQVEEWLLINETKGEFCVQNTGNCIQQLQVGEVVGIKYLDERRKDVFILGVISWLRVYSDDLIKLGIKLVSASAIPIEVRPVSGDITPDQNQRAFLLPLRKELSQLSSVFGIPASLRSGAAVAITIYGKEIQVRLTSKLINSGLYSQYQFEALAKQVVQKKQKARARTKKAGSDTGFDDIWDAI
ncbi:MAG: hypothetical protein P8Y24_13280 [Gammaproteobacteria bacterium]